MRCAVLTLIDSRQHLPGTNHPVVRMALRLQPARTLSEFLGSVERIRRAWREGWEYDTEPLWFRGERKQLGRSSLVPLLYREFSDRQQIDQKILTDLLEREVRHFGDFARRAEPLS